MMFNDSLKVKLQFHSVAFAAKPANQAWIMRGTAFREDNGATHARTRAALDRRVP